MSKREQERSRLEGRMRESEPERKSGLRRGNESERERKNEGEGVSD